MLNVNLMKEQLKLLNKSLRDISLETNISYSVISKVFNGFMTNPTSSTILPILRALNLKFEEVWNDNLVIVNNPKRTIEDKTDLELMEDIKKLGLRQKQTIRDVVRAQLGLKTDGKIKTLKVYEQSACAGDGNIIDSEDYELVEFSNSPVTASFCVKIQGESMQPLIDDGQVVFVQAGVQLQENDIGIFCFQGDVFCKQLKQKNGKVTLTSLNKKYEDRTVYFQDDLTIVGRVL